MKKIALLLLVSLGTFAQEITPKSIIQRSLDAVGGLEKISTIKDMTLIMESEIQGQAMTAKTIKKAPNKLFTEVEIGGMGVVNKTVFDGTSGYMEAMGQKTPLDSTMIAALKSQASMVSELSMFENLDKYTYAGIEKFNGVDCHVLKSEVKTPKPASTIEYFQVSDGLKVGQKITTETPMGEMTMVTTMKDYREVDGLKIPYTLSQDMGMMQIDLKIKEVKINSGVEDSVFKVD